MNLAQIAHSFYADLCSEEDEDLLELRDGDIPALFLQAGRHRVMKSAMPKPLKKLEADHLEIRGAT